MFPDYPFDSNWLDRHGQRLHYLDEGPRDGDVVVMLHGNPTWSFYYRRLILAWRDRCRCIVPDHLGMGRSDKPQDYAYTVASHVDNLDALLTSLDVGNRVTFICHDWGGMIGMSWATRHVERIARIGLMNTAAFRMPPRWQWPWQLHLARAPFFGALAVRGFNAFCYGAAKTCMTRRAMSPDELRGYLAPYDSWPNRVAVHAFVRDIPVEPGDTSYDVVHETEQRLGHLAHVPTQIVWGTNDFVFDEHFLERWQKFMPHAEVQTLDAGHYVLEDAYDDVIACFTRFLDDHPLRP